MRVTWCLAVFLCLNVRAWAGLPVYEAPRQWKTADGQVFTAGVMSYEGGVVVVRLPNGQKWQTPVEKLSAEDAAYLEDWKKRQPVVVVMPDVAGVDATKMKVEVVGEDEKHGKYVYRTEHFEFESEGKFTTSLLRDVGRNFEATYELLKALPWGIEPAPEEGEYFHARLLRTRERYEAAGAPMNSGGVYMSRYRVFLVPFDSIGLKVVGKSYAASDDYETHTVVHELTHQMMHDWLEILPPWVVEGTAEYAGVLPLKVGKFRVSAAKTGLKDYLDFLRRRTTTGVPVPYPLEELFTVTPQRWNEILATNPQMSARLYFTSYLLVYYFMHLDGQGDGQLFVKYFRTVDEARRQVTAYEKAMEAFLKQPGVEVFPDGSFRYPAGMEMPQKPEFMRSPEALAEYQKQTLQILLNGRTETELMKDIRSAYMRLGIKL